MGVRRTKVASYINRGRYRTSCLHHILKNAKIQSLSRLVRTCVEAVLTTVGSFLQDKDCDNNVLSMVRHRSRDFNDAAHISVRPPVYDAADISEKISRSTSLLGATIRVLNTPPIFQVQCMSGVCTSTGQPRNPS